VALQRVIFLVVLKILGMGLFYFMHMKEDQALCGNVKQRLCVPSSPLFKEGLRYPSPGGRGSDCPLARTATVRGRKCRSHSKGVAHHGMSRYVTLV